jgi:hypothetical protein
VVPFGIPAKYGFALPGTNTLTVAPWASLPNPINEPTTKSKQEKIDFMGSLISEERMDEKLHASTCVDALSLGFEPRTSNNLRFGLPRTGAILKNSLDKVVG